MAQLSSHCCAVQGKILCVFETTVYEQGSAKRPHQPFKVVATEKLADDAKSVIVTSVATEKLDGTSCCVRLFQGKPWLWVRRDRRPTKAAEKQFRKHQTKLQSSCSKAEAAEATFAWDVVQHFKEIPENWVPADRVARDELGQALPADGGHIPGWVPADPSSRSQCWHLTAVDLQYGLALVLRSEDDGNQLEIRPVPLADLLGSTLELIGTNVNGNPYGLGSKICPVHVLVQHGIIRADAPPPTNFDALKSWFAEKEAGLVEGVVWHCQDGSLFKVHRHHLSLPWPVAKPSFSLRPVRLRTSLQPWDVDADPESLMGQLSALDQVQCSNFADMNARLTPEPEPLPDK